MAVVEPLTKQQAAIKEWADRGYAAPEIAEVVGCSPSLVYDQIGYIRKKGHTVELVRARSGDLVVKEAERIARNAR